MSARRSQSQYKDVLINTISDIAVLPVRARFVGPTGDQAALTPAGITAPIGVVHQGGCEPGAWIAAAPPYVVSVIVLGTSVLELAQAAVTGAFLTTAPDGTAVVAAAGVPALARALEPGNPGDTIEVLLLPAVM